MTGSVQETKRFRVLVGFEKRHQIDRTKVLFEHPTYGFSVQSGFTPEPERYPEGMEFLMISDPPIHHVAHQWSADVPNHHLRFFDTELAALLARNIIEEVKSS